MQHSDKYKLAQQIGDILTQNGAVSYGVARDILQLCGELLKRSAVLSPLVPKEVVEKRLPEYMPFPPGEYERIPDERCRAEVYVGEDGKLALSLGMFAVHNYPHHIEIPFSDFTESFASISDFERLVVDLLNRQLPK